MTREEWVRSKKTVFKVRHADGREEIRLLMHDGKYKTFKSRDEYSKFMMGLAVETLNE